MQEEPVQSVVSPAPQVIAPVQLTPTTTTNPIAPVATSVPTGRHYLAVFFFSFVWGIFGADRFYLGKLWTGLLKLVTVGGLGIWVLVDLSQIMSGAMRDKQGRPMLEYDRYKKFAQRTVMIFTIIVIVMVVATGVSLYYAITGIMNQYMQSGSGLNNLIPGGVQNLNVNQLMNL